MGLVISSVYPTFSLSFGARLNFEATRMEAQRGHTKKETEICKSKLRSSDPSMSCLRALKLIALLSTNSCPGVSMGREGGAGRQKIQNTTHEIDPIPLNITCILQPLKLVQSLIMVFLY